MRVSVRPFVLAAFMTPIGFAAQTAFPAPGQTAPDWAIDAGSDPAYAATKAICKAARSTPLPTPAPSGDDHCDSTNLLYGIGGPIDPAAARACAIREAAHDPDDPIGGNATLATIYANGTGVPRDLDRAIAYACRLSSAPAEANGRIAHLAALRQEAASREANRTELAKPFDVCDDITSGLMEGLCAKRDGSLADQKRDRTLDDLARKLDKSAAAAFARLRRAERSFVDASAEGEVDTGGTARGAFIESARQAHDDVFLATAQAVVEGAVPAGSPEAADARLNAAYRKAMAVEDPDTIGAVHKAGIKAAQRAWLAYRDAFAAFARSVRMPPERLVAALATARAAELGDLASR